MSQQIYLDYNATAPLRPEVVMAMTQAMQAPHNASSLHGFGRAGRKMIEAAREEVALLCGAPHAQVIFNSGATEGNNTVLCHFAGARIVVSAIEHPSVLETVKAVTQNYEIVPVTSEGLVDLLALEAALKKERPALVSVMAVNNETGVIQPVREVSALAHRYGALFHCDGVQAAGKIPLDMAAQGIDFLTLSAHKFGGPQGVGALVLGICGETPTLLHGGGQEKRARAGTENVAGLTGFGVAARIAREHLAVFQELSRLRDGLETFLRQTTPDLLIYGGTAPRVAGTSLFSVAGVSSETLLMALDLEGIAVSNGSACSSGRVEPSTVLRAMHAPEDHLRGALRVSMGWATGASDVAVFQKSWGTIMVRLKRS